MPSFTKQTSKGGSTKVSTKVTTGSSSATRINVQPPKRQPS